MTNTTRAGQVAELIAMAYYYKQGYEVFKNSSVTGPIDFIIWKPGITPIMIDTKSVSWRQNADGEWKTGGIKPSPLQVKCGIQIAYVDRQHNVVSTSIDELRKLCGKS